MTWRHNIQQRPELKTCSFVSGAVCFIHFPQKRRVFKNTTPVRIELTILRLTVARLNQLGHGVTWHCDCDVVAKRYDLYFGSCDHVGTRWYLRCSFRVIVFVGPLGDTLSFGDLCSVYKAGCCRSSGLGKKQVSLRYKITKATQQDLCNHILLRKTNGMWYALDSTTLRLGNLWALFIKSLCYIGWSTEI